MFYMKCMFFLKHSLYIEKMQHIFIYFFPLPLVCQRIFTRPSDYIKHFVPYNITGLYKCLIKIRAPLGHRIILEFEHINFQLLCKKAYMEITNGFEKPTKYCKDKLPPKIFISRGNNFFITFVFNKKYTYLGKNGFGFKVKYKSKCQNLLIINKVLSFELFVALLFLN